MDFLIAQARKKYHRDLLESILTIDKEGIPSNADRSSKISISIAKGITDRLIALTQEKALGQTCGKKFEECNMQFIQNTKIIMLLTGKQLRAHLTGKRQ